ncbi:tetratricopeptide repeat protein [Plasticicumulans acidivorans]|uniref:Tetratricopeptide (TPR) repeat protein n=1 Tax=Plasticicumulans acidivorans TaxID=886464 RepID=A0A317N1X9_9GAMM|nr:tetratricopeptide repeat protein [Plasticicumulans acidivorans]PWV63293.1 tetratricopeptide (TPR) repeat protein [Plasticicumulans acidivorans]
MNGDGMKQMATGEELLQRAYAAHVRGELDTAIELYRRVLPGAGGHVEALFMYGTALLQRGEFEQARVQLERVLSLQPGHAEALNNLGLGLGHAGELAAGLERLERALALRPQYGDAWNNYGNLLERSGRLEDAAAAYRRLIALEPQRFDGHYNLGLILRRLQHYDDALAALRGALELDPARRARVLNDLGALCHEAGRLEEAAQWLHEALQLEPGFYAARNNYAACLEEMGREYLPQALEQYRAAAALQPDNPLPRWNAAFVELALGRLASGWEGYELRWAQHPDTRHPAFPQWQGESLAGRTILVYPEQGLGDEILFASCLPELMAQALHVGILCDRRLAPLYARSFPDATVYGGREPGSENWSAQVAGADCCVAIGSLPRWLRRRLEDFPARTGYLVADAGRTSHWRAWLQAQAAGRRLVGLCWRSGLRSGARHRYYTAIEDCAPLFALDEVVYVNLQYDDCAAELALARERYGARILECPGIDLRNDQDELAALICALDAVVSAPTAVAELAAALGVPVLRQGLGWTSLGSERMPWHPTMQVFLRPTAVAPWAPVIAAMAAALPQTLAHGGAREVVAPLHTGPARCVEAALRLLKLGLPGEALRLCGSALAQDEGHADAWYLQGVLQYRNGERDAAIASLDRAIAGNPLEALIYLARAHAFEDCGDTLAALRDYQLAQAFDAGCAEARQALARLAAGEVCLPDVDAAVLAAYRAALALHGPRAELLERYARALHEQGQLAAAEAAFGEALRQQPRLASAWSGLEALLLERSRFADARAAGTQACALAPGEPQVSVTHAFTLLMLGELAAGWDAYEARWQAGAQPPLPARHPQWNGEDLSGRSLLLLPEQGLGDEILFASCIADVLCQAREVVLVCQQRLESLYRRVFAQARVIALPAGEVQLPADLPACDYQCGIGSLPRWLRRSLANFPAHDAYLQADAVAGAHWRQWLDTLGDGLKVGICWRSGLRSGYRRRQYTELDEWAPLFAVPGVVFVNLQYDDCTAELEALAGTRGVRVVPPPALDLRNDLDGVAALLTALDAVISAPTAVAELAAALGRPVLRYGRGWTSLGTGDMPWHPSMRVFAREPDGGWGTAIAAMARVLAGWAAHGRVDLAQAPADVPAPPAGIGLVSTEAGVLLALAGEHAPRDGATASGFGFVERLLPAGGTVLLAGSGDGLAALSCAAAVGAGGMVLVLEGRAEAAALLAASFVLNGVRHAWVECADAAGVEPSGLSSPLARWRAETPAPALERLGRCDLLWIEHPRPLVVLARLHALLVRCKPFVYVVGGCAAAALADWEAAHTYAHISCTAAAADGSPRVDLLLHPSV